jgi:hypothetical protein
MNPPGGLSRIIFAFQAATTNPTGAAMSWLEIDVRRMIHIAPIDAIRKLVS